MQRYMAGDLPPRAVQDGGAQQTPFDAAMRLGAFIRQERGREGAAAFVSALGPLLPAQMTAQLAAQMGVPAPAQGQGATASGAGSGPSGPQETQNGGQAQPKQKPPDMESLLKLMQAMKGGGGGKDLGALMQLLKT